VLALGSRPNDFAIAGLAQRALSLYSASDAERVWESVSTALTAAAAASDPERRRPAHQSVAANVILVGQRSTVHTSLCAAAAVDEESVDTYRQDLASPPPSESRPQGGRLLVRVDVVLHPSVGNQPDRCDQDVRRDSDPYPQQGADYAGQVNQRADLALEVATKRLPQRVVRSTTPHDTQLKEVEGRSS
jgi:hypothetical protein